MIEVENTDVNIVRNLIPMRNHMPASAYGLKAISDWFSLKQQFKTDQQQSYRVTLSMPTPSFELSFKHIRREVPSTTRYEHGPTDKNANIF